MPHPFSVISLCALLALPLSGLAATGGFSTATGSNAAAVTVATLAQLQAAVQQHHHHIIVAGHLYGGPQLTNLSFADTDWNNTTIEGAESSGAALENIQLKFDGEKLAGDTNIENIVIKNLSFYGRIADLQALPPQATGTSNNAGVNYEGVSLRRISNAWIDHCDFHDTSDDLLSVTLSSDNVTISHSRFYFSKAWATMQPNPIWNWVGNWQDLAGERLAMVVGANRNDSYHYGGHHLHVTLHDNWFGPYLRGRPLLRGWVHVYNNYFDNSDGLTGQHAAGYPQGQYEALQIGSGSVVISEGNYFYATHASNKIGLDRADDVYTFEERSDGPQGNLYHATTGPSMPGAPRSETRLPYDYLLRPAAEVMRTVQQQAGPR